MIRSRLVLVCLSLPALATAAFAQPFAESCGDDIIRFHASASARDAWIKTRDGHEYVGHVWPGACVFPDFTRADTRDWWAGLYGDFLANGIDGVWNDMNEPAVFNVDTKTMPLDNRHRADPELGGSAPHARYHNVYGMLMARAIREGCLRARPDKRLFVLSRANYIGGQRYAARQQGGLMVVTSDLIEGDWTQARRPLTVRILAEDGERRAEGTEDEAISIRR